jgi:tRNA A-37 threonylcarbamoyl transferase component Bud32
VAYVELLSVSSFTAWTAYRLKHDDVPAFLHFSACMLLADTAVLDILSWVAPKLLPTTPALSQVLQTGMSACNFRFSCSAKPSYIGSELFFLTCLSVHATAVKPGPVLCSWNIILTALRRRLRGLTRTASQTYVDIQSGVQAARSLKDGGHNSDKDQCHNLRESLYAEAEFDHCLGFGEYYRVNAMILRRLDKIFARKSLRECVQELPDTIRDKVVAGLRSEAAILELIKKQPHPHLPIIQGAYLDGEDTYIDISPVGNSDLRKYIDEFTSREELLDLKKQIVRGFSCLASQLEHLHKRLNIFHGDIRPRNVIMVQGIMALIDYSMSIDLSDAPEISGRALFLSRATCAPECNLSP